VNRTGHGKSAGIVVDYYGVARHLKEALSAYTDEDIEGALQSFKDEIPKLRDQNRRAEYTANWWNVLDWTRIAERYAAAKAGTLGV
jgi:type I site-specific restriction-modification system R (restriction) subunit